MVNFLLMTGLLAASLASIILVRRARRRSHQGAGASAEQLGTISQQWLTTHRAER